MARKRITDTDKAISRKESLEESVVRNINHPGFDATERINSEMTEYQPRDTKGSEDLAKQETRRATLSRYLNELLVLNGQSPVKSDDEMVYRLDSYFRRCAAIGKTPTWEEIPITLGIDSRNVEAMLQGRHSFSPVTQSILAKTKQLLKAFDAQLVIGGQLNPITYFFRAKNYYDMVDKKEVTLEAKNAIASDETPEEIEKRYMDIEDDD